MTAAQHVQQTETALLRKRRQRKPASGMHSRMTTDPSATSVELLDPPRTGRHCEGASRQERFPHGDHTERSQPQIRLQIGLVLEQPAGHGLFGI